MMRGSRLLAVAVSAPYGNIVLHEEPVNAALYRGPISKITFVRGLTMLWDALGLGMRSLMFSANVAVGDEAEFSGPLAWGTIASFGSSLFLCIIKLADTHSAALRRRAGTTLDSANACARFSHCGLITS
jgi:uncharacterized protein YqhQ